MKAQDMFDYWEERLDKSDWTLDSAKTVLEAWQQEFTRVQWLFFFCMKNAVMHLFEFSLFQSCLFLNRP